MPDMPRSQCPSCAYAGARPSLMLDNGRFIAFCPSCDIGYTCPPRQETELINYYANTFYNSHMMHFDADRVHVFAADFRRVSRGLTKGALLDFGCGFGHFIRLAVDRGWDAKGVDVAGQVVRIAREELHLDVRQGGVEAIGAWGIRFEMVTLWNVLDHLRDPAAILRELRGVLADRGRIVLRIHNFGIRKIVFRLGRSLRIPFLQNNFALFLDCCFTAATIRRILRRSGYRNIVVRNSSLAADVKGRQLGKSILGIIQCCLSAAYYITFGSACLGPSLLVTAEKGSGELHE